MKLKVALNIAVLVIAAYIYFSCSTQDASFNPKQAETAVCHAFVVDSTIAEDADYEQVKGLPVSDTIHTGTDTLTFVGVVVPENAVLKDKYWDFGDNTSSTSAIVRHVYTRSGVYTAVFTITDNAGFSLSDTVSVHVNTPPKVDSLIQPVNGQTGIDPTDARGIRFEWNVSGVDSGDTPLVDFYLSMDTVFLQPSVFGISASLLDYKTTLFVLKTYYWRIIVKDRYGESDTGKTYRFSTKDPNATDGSLNGYVFFQGWKNHQGIVVSIKAQGIELLSDTTNDSGYYGFTHLTPKIYSIYAGDSVKREFVSDTTIDTVMVGTITVAETLYLKDNFKPVVSNNVPTGVQTQRKPQVAVVWSDTGSGVFATSVIFMVNGVDMSVYAVVTQESLRWIPSQNLPDGNYAIAVGISDSAGNRADTLKWDFTVDAMKLTVMSDTTVRINDTVTLHGIVQDVYSAVAIYKWDYDGNGTWDDSSVVSPITKHIFTHETTCPTVMYARDDSGMVKQDTVKITVMNMAPSITVRDSTTISIKDTVTLWGSGKDEDGRIAEYAWDAEGDGVFEFISAADSVTVHVYNTAGVYKAVFRITDDDGKAGKDTVVVTVLQDVPVPNAGIDTTVIINTLVTLKGSYIHQFGTLVMYKWDFDGDNVYDDSSSTSAVTTHTYTHEASYTAKFYVRDDDSNEATDVRVVTVQNATPVITSIRHDTTISIKDSIALTGTAIDNDGSIIEYAWDYMSDGVFEYTHASVSNTGFRYNTAGTYTVVFRATDDDGKAGKDTVVVTVLQDAPVVNAGIDTTVSINDTVHLHGNATQQFGSIVKWEWDVGNTGTFRQGSKDTVIFAPAVENLNYRCVLRVTDDDGNVVNDSVFIHVRQDAPGVNTGLDTTVSINDTIRLHGNVTQQFGSIVRWEWDVGNTGLFRQGCKDTLAFAPAVENLNYRCVLRATDDDENVVMDTVVVHVLQDVPVTNVGNDTVVYMNDHVALHGTATQQFGSIVKWEWNIGNIGFIETTHGCRGDTVITTPSAHWVNYPCILRVTDDDGNIVLDSMMIGVGKWVVVGNPGFSAGNVTYTSLAINNGTPYVAYRDDVNGFKATVMKYDGSMWVTVGNLGFSAGAAGLTSLAIDNSTPYVVYEDSPIGNKATVMKYDGSTWVTVGSRGFSAGNMGYSSLAIDNGTLYVAYSNGGANVMKYDGSAWVAVGSPSFSEGGAEYISLAIDNGTPYVAYTDMANSYKSTVMKYNGSNWIVVGNQGFSSGPAFYTSLAIDGGTPYVAFRDKSTGYKSTVMKYDGYSWVIVGNPGFSTGDTSYISLAMYNNSPYIAFNDWDDGKKITVMKYNGDLWIDVGSQSFSVGEIYLSSLVLYNGIPYVAFQDLANDNKATVMKLK